MITIILALYVIVSYFYAVERLYLGVILISRMIFATLRRYKRGVCGYKMLLCVVMSFAILLKCLCKKQFPLIC